MREPGPLNFIQALNRHVKEIDLSVNKVGMVSIDYFTKLLKTKSESLDLKIVKMDKTQIGDEAITKLLKAFEETDKPHML